MKVLRIYLLPDLLFNFITIPSFRRNGNNHRTVQKKLQRLFGKMGLSRELLEHGSGLLKQPI